MSRLRARDPRLATSPAKPNALVLLAVLAVTLLASRGWPDTTPALTAPPATTAPSPEPAPSPSPSPSEWRVDEQGRRYKIVLFPKSQPHQRMEDGKLRTVWGFSVDLAGEDEHDFFVKSYETGEGRGPAPLRLSEAEKQAAADTFSFELRQEQHLNLERFDAGLPTSGQWRDQFAVADVNGDGLLDVVHGPPRRRPGPPVIFLGDGKGTWRRFSEAEFPRQRYDYGAAVVSDFDGDKRPDIGLGMHLLGISALRQATPGRWEAASAGMDPLEGQPSTAFSSHALLVLDWDRDGHLDLLALGEGPRLELQQSSARSVRSVNNGLLLYRNKGDGSWERLAGPRSAAGLFGEKLVALRLANGTNAVVTATSARGRRDLLFVPGKPYEQRTLEALRPEALVYALAVGDFDGNRQADLAVGYAAYAGEAWHSGLDVLLQDRQGSFRRTTVWNEPGAWGVTGLGAGDLDKDGRADIVALTGDGRTRVFRSAGGGSFTLEPGELTERAEACRGVNVQIADLDKDGRGDIVAAFAGEEEGFGGFSQHGCPGEGFIRAWRSAPSKPGARPETTRPSPRP